MPARPAATLPTVMATVAPVTILKTSFPCSQLRLKYHLELLQLLLQQDANLFSGDSLLQRGCVYCSGAQSLAKCERNARDRRSGKLKEAASSHSSISLGLDDVSAVQWIATAVHEPISYTEDVETGGYRNHV